MADHAQHDSDICIVGGGLVGASLAAALAGQDLRIAVVEAFAADDHSQPAYDERTVALTWSARQIFSGIGVWDTIAAAGAEPIVDIHVSNRGHFGATHLAADDVGTEALGYVVPTRVIGQVLNQHLEAAKNVTLFRPAEASRLESSEDHATITVQSDNTTGKIISRLAVLADGGRSSIGAGFEVDETPYTQQALLCIVSTDRPHNGRAFERFTEEGPIALLPHSDRRYAVVWTGEAALVRERLCLDDADFISALQDAFGDRAGLLARPGPRKAYPLTRSHLTNPVGARRVVVGNAAHTVHPVAGQGFNLGLRDVAWLAELLWEAHCSGNDPGDAKLLRHYADGRRAEAKRVETFTHGLISVFSSGLPGAALARNAVLGTIEHLPFAKRLLLRRTMGLHGRSSMLASGQRFDV